MKHPFAAQVSRVSLPRVDEYLGVDVSARALATAAKVPKGSFAVLDAVSSNLPLARTGRPFDLVLNRHMTYHLPSEDTLAALRRFGASGAKYLLATTHLVADENERTFVLADGHAVNLFRAPYCLRDPLLLFPDGAPDVYLGLWALEGAPLADPRSCRTAVDDLTPLIVDEGGWPPPDGDDDGS